MLLKFSNLSSVSQLPNSCLESQYIGEDQNKDSKGLKKKKGSKSQMDLFSSKGKKDSKLMSKLNNYYKSYDNGKNC